MIRSIQNRIVLLITLLGIGMVAGIFLSQKADDHRIESLLEKKKTENAVLLKRVVDFKSKSLNSYVFDYTYWDEMVSFIRTKDQQWANDMIEVSLPTFQCDYAWVYDTGLVPVYSTNSGDNEAMPALPMTAKELETLVAGGSLYDFFIKTKSALIQISGGSVHPTSDPERKTASRGYFFVGRIWRDQYLNELEEFTGTSLAVMDLVNDSLPVDSLIRQEFKLVNFMSLNGWNGKPQACLRSIGIMEIAKDFRERSQNSLVLLATSLFLALGFVSFILIKFINRPLKNLIISLVTDDPKPIRGLVGQKSEFGHIAQLMSNFFIQKKKLVEEIGERIKIENELIIARDRAEEGDRLKTAFLNNLSHEIRTPMNAIVGFSELIEDPGISEEEKLEFTGIIRESTYRLLGTITDLLSLSTIESGQEVVKEEKINLNSFLQGIFAQIKRDIDTKPITLQLDVALKDEHSQIITDRAKLNQIILNLLKNSLKFTKSGRIGFGYVIRQAEIEFFVLDTGVGIPSEKFETIFVRFQQVDDSLSREHGGAGLGLPISKAYVELLGGRIWLKSEVGKGSVFHFTIPYKTPK